MNINLTWGKRGKSFGLTKVFEGKDRRPTTRQDNNEMRFSLSLMILLGFYQREASGLYLAARPRPTQHSAGCRRAHLGQERGPVLRSTNAAGIVGVIMSLSFLNANSPGVFAIDQPVVEQEQLVIEKKTVSVAETPSQTLEDQIESIQISPLEKELQDYEEDLEMAALMEKKEPKRLITKLNDKLNKAAKKISLTGKSSGEELVDNARERVLTLKAYLDEVERDLFSKNWDNLQVYLYTFADQEDAFALLIEQLFPNNNPLDKSAREAMAFEAQSMFLSLDQLREAARLASPERARVAYSRLLLSYDRFLKAGDLYPTYDPITSTAIFFANTPQSTLRFDAKARVQVLDQVLLTAGPDMGKIATVINIDGNNAVVKLDKDGKAYQEVKFVKLDILAKTIEDKPLEKKQGN